MCVSSSQAGVIVVAAQKHTHNCTLITHTGHFVLGYVVLPADFTPRRLADLDVIRARLLERLVTVHPSVVVDLCFTTDRRFGAPGLPVEVP